MFTRKVYDNIPKYSDMQFQYKYNIVDKTWDVFEDDGCIAAIDAYADSTFKDTSGSIDLDMKILDDYKLFQQRPEYKIIDIQIPSNSEGTLEDLIDTYETLFAGAVFIRAQYHKVGCNPDDAWPQIERALEWLRTTDFYKAPASTRFHDAYVGGLCYHSLNVAERAVQLMSSPAFADSSKLGDAVFCALVHDWCKIDLYEPYMKNVKNENTGVWEKVAAFRFTGSAVINLGHGVSSMFLISKFFRLNLEEAAAIRWHMGAYRTTDTEFNELQTCNEQFMLVHLLQFADQLSLVSY